ncbi:sulfotransferase [Shimia sp. MMG029]|uniref:sulfotransferase n=1 Tax=Shimia sp. MMG029 TaxID=3021978 RepID=UPI0022FF287E|nr:sulfotransferase [Shimia sp. MMG029]MDA5558525.1 sulfotransferase [Shimia sp. MMG029]
MAEQRFHFIAGLPRSGSTLLAALLHQNPNFHAPGTSPASSFLEAVHTQINTTSEASALLDGDQRQALLKGVLSSVHCAAPDSGMVFDSSRRWLSKVDLLVALFPLCQFILCVRDPVEVLQSLERLYQQDPVQHSKLFKAGTTAQERVDRLLAPEGLVGRPLALVRDALLGRHSSRMIVLDHAVLQAAPHYALTRLYDLLRAQPFDHDFDNLDADQPALDHFLNTPGLHRVTGAVRVDRKPPALADSITNPLAGRDFWNHPLQTEASLILSAPKAQTP